MATTLDKTAVALYNEDPVHKFNAQPHSSAVRLPHHVPFQMGIKSLWETVEDVKAMNVLPADMVDKWKKELLYCYLSENPDFRDVLKVRT